MSEAAEQRPESGGAAQAGNLAARGERGALVRKAPGLPVMMRVVRTGGGGEVQPGALKLVDANAAPAAREKPRRESDVLKGLKDLQQLQRQTVEVLEGVRGALDDIGQVLRSPEATRGLEKQKNAAMLLARGFSRDAVEQAQGAVELLPANPEAHLLLALSLAADRQESDALAATRKGLALFDRRAHPLAIEAGLLHALAALGRGPEAVDRWKEIVRHLPTDVLLEHLGRIGACFPADASEGRLDRMIVRRLMKGMAEDSSKRKRPGHGEEFRRGRAAEAVPVRALFDGLESAFQHRLPGTHRTVLGMLASRLKEAREPADVARFLTECVVPLGNMGGLDRAVGAMARAAVKRLLAQGADAMTLHRAMLKLEMAGAVRPARELAKLLRHWRRAGQRARRVRRLIALSLTAMVAGVCVLAFVLWGEGAATGSPVLLHVGPATLDAVWIGPLLVIAGALMGVAGLLSGSWEVQLPCGRGPLTGEEIAYLRTAGVRQSIRGVLAHS